MNNDYTEKRSEKRLSYNWPVWFAEDFGGILAQGQMADISSADAAFTCYADKCPLQGQNITARFSIPIYDADESFCLENLIKEGSITRVEEVNPFMRKVVLKFHEPLDFEPGEQVETDVAQTTFATI